MKNQESYPSLKSGWVKLKHQIWMVFLLVKFIPPRHCLIGLKVWTRDSKDSSYETIIQIMQLFALIYVEGWLKLFLSVVPPVEHWDHRHCCRWRRYPPAVCCQGKSINQPTQSGLKNVNSAPLTHMSQCVLFVFWPCVHGNSYYTGEITLCIRPISFSIHKFVLLILKPLLRIVFI